MQKMKIISAGMIFFHLYGTVFEEDKIFIDVIDNYRYLPDTFYQKSKERIVENRDNKDLIHIFGIVEMPEKVNNISSIIKDGIQL